MAEILVFNSTGVKELKCFDTLDEVDYLTDEVDAAEFDEVADILSMKPLH